jgi:cell shape-determining protein MreC
MKRQYSHRPNSVGPFTWTFGVAFFVLFLLFLVRAFIPGTFFSLAAPLWREGTALDASVGSVFVGLTHAQQVALQNAALGQQVQTLQNENAVLTARAQDLTKLLGGQGAAGISASVVAGVLARPPESPYDTIVVAAGTDDGVVAGAQAFAAGGIPIGTVESATKHSAVIGLLSTPGRMTDGWAGASRTQVTFKGSGAGAFTATIPRAAAVSVGDNVYVPGPGAVPFGTVVRIDSEAASPTVVLEIQPLVNLFSLTWVEIAGS